MRRAALILAAVLASSMGSAAMAGHGGAYFVAGFGDDYSEGQYRYWGGPYFVSCRGYHPPYDTYRMSCRRVAKVVVRNHGRHMKVRLK
jgi:hypothetical protein